MVTIAPVPEIPSELPLASDASVLASDTGVDVSEVPAAILNVRVATAPFPIPVVFNPEMIQRTSLAEMALHVARLSSRSSLPRHSRHRVLSLGSEPSLRRSNPIGATQREYYLASNLLQPRQYPRAFPFLRLVKEQAIVPSRQP